jgi:hypothetical protein
VGDGVVLGGHFLNANPSALSLPPAKTSSNFKMAIAATRAHVGAGESIEALMQANFPLSE